MGLAEMAWPKSLWIVGCGNMGGAILGRWLEAGLDPTRVTVIDPHAQNLPAGITRCDSAPTDVPPPELLLLAIKPQMLGDLAPGIAVGLSPNTLLLSILAATPLTLLREHFASVEAVVRIMPNMAVSVGKAPVLAVDDPALEVATRAQVEALLAPLGGHFWLAEEQMALGTALAGSGPAFLFRFIDALGGAAHDLGLPADQAAALALQMVEGAAQLAAASEVAPGTLADRVASPGGVTREGLNVIDEGQRLRHLLRDVLRAARDRDAAMIAEFHGR